MPTLSEHPEGTAKRCSKTTHREEVTRKMRAHSLNFPLNASRCEWLPNKKAGELGFEPRLKRPERSVLPLHHSPFVHSPRAISCTSTERDTPTLVRNSFAGLWIALRADELACQQALYAFPASLSSSMRRGRSGQNSAKESFRSARFRAADDGIPTIRSIGSANSGQTGVRVRFAMSSAVAPCRGPGRAIFIMRSREREIPGGEPNHGNRPRVQHLTIRLLRKLPRPTPRRRNRHIR